MGQSEQVPSNQPVESEGSSSSHRTRFFVMGAVVALAVGYMVYAAFPGNTLYFLTVNEFLADEQYQDGRLLRVSGKLVEGSFQRQAGSSLSHFQLTDEEGNSEGQLAASYVGVMPDLFFNPHSEIILEGRSGPDGVFEADSILVKCPSKYQSLEEEEYRQQPSPIGQ